MPATIQFISVRAAFVLCNQMFASYDHAQDVGYHLHFGEPTCIKATPRRVAWPLAWRLTRRCPVVRKCFITACGVRARSWWPDCEKFCDCEPAWFFKAHSFWGGNGSSQTLPCASHIWLYLISFLSIFSSHFFTLVWLPSPCRKCDTHPQRDQWWPCTCFLCVYGYGGGGKSSHILKGWNNAGAY